jgi:hypothetical protein
VSDGAVGSLCLGWMIGKEGEEEEEEKEEEVV